MSTNSTTGMGRPSDELADWVATAIRSGELAPGTWLKQVDLERRYQVSRADVRRALEILLQKRLVEQFPGRGFYVRNADSRRKKELQQIRITLETSMADSIIGNPDRGSLETIQQLAVQFENAANEGDLVACFHLNQDFHVALAALCSNQEFGKLVIELHNHIPTSPTSQWPNLTRARQSAAEHLAMIAAIKAGDNAKLKALLTSHITPEN